MKHFLKIAAAGVLCLCLIFTAFPERTLFAASANLSFFAEENTTSAGREFTLTLEISADVTIGDFEGYFTYDDSIVEYTYGPSCITGGDGYLKISDMNAAPSYGMRNYVMTFTAKKRGVCQFRMSGIPVVYAYDSGNSMSVLSESYQLTVQAADNASKDATAAALKISPGTLNPAFSPDITEYEVELSYETERLIVSAIAADTNALVSISGNEQLAVGENRVNVTVTAEDGTVLVYHILAKRMEEESWKEPVSPTQSADVLTPEGEKRKVAVSEDGAMITGTYRYHFAKDISRLTVPEEYEADYLLIDGQSIPVYVTSRQSEYCLITLTNEAGESGLYRFDRKEYTIQRYTPEIVTVADTSGQNQKINELLAETRSYEQKKNTMSIICGLLGVVIVLLLLLCVRMHIRSKGIDEDL